MTDIQKRMISAGNKMVGEIKKAEEVARELISVLMATGAITSKFEYTIIDCDGVKAWKEIMKEVEEENEPV